MQLYATRDIPEIALQQLREECKPELQIEPPREVGFRAADARSIIHLVADAIEWLPLTAAATVFLTQLAKRAADDLWDNKAKVVAALKNPAAASLKKIARAFAAVRAQTPSRLQISIALAVPDDYFGTALIFDAEDEGTAALLIARFVVKADEIEIFMKREAASERPPFGPAHITIEEDGTLRITWMDQKDLEQHEHRFDP